MKRIIEISENSICLFCGEPEKRQINSDYEEWYDCDCSDAVKEKEIMKQIRILHSQRPSPKFEIVEARILRTVYKPYN
jgi:hypothetical protein